MPRSLPRLRTNRLSEGNTQSIKELQAKIEGLEEELAIDRQNRNKTEKNRSTLSRDFADLGEKLEDAGNNTATQIELNKKREAKLHKLKAEMEESNIAFEGVLANTRSKHNSVISEMKKGCLKRELQECKNALDAAIRERHNVK